MRSINACRTHKSHFGKLPCSPACWPWSGASLAGRRHHTPANSTHFKQGKHHTLSIISRTHRIPGLSRVLPATHTFTSSRGCRGHDGGGDRDHADDSPSVVPGPGKQQACDDTLTNLARAHTNYVAAMQATAEGAAAALEVRLFRVVVLTCTAVCANKMCACVHTALRRI